MSDLRELSDRNLLRGRLEGAAASATMGYPRDPEGYERLTDLLLEAASALAHPAPEKE